MNNPTPTNDERVELGCRCQVCARLYKLDVFVPDDLWARIIPPGRSGDGGLLCGGCILARTEEVLGFSGLELRVLP